MRPSVLISGLQPRYKPTAMATGNSPAAQKHPFGMQLRLRDWQSSCRDNGGSVRVAEIERRPRLVNRSEQAPPPPQHAAIGTSRDQLDKDHPHNAE